MNVDDFWPQDRHQNDPRQTQDGSKRVLRAFFFDVELCVRFCSVLGSILAPLGSLLDFKIDLRIVQKADCANIAQKDGFKDPKAAPRGPKTLPEVPRSPQEAAKTPPRRSQEAPRGTEDPTRPPQVTLGMPQD